MAVIAPAKKIAIDKCNFGIALRDRVKSDIWVIREGVLAVSVYIRLQGRISHLNTTRKFVREDVGKRVPFELRAIEKLLLFFFHES